MVYRDQKESDDLLDKLVASTRSPHGQFTAEKSWPLLQKRIQGGFGWYLWNHRVASLESSGGFFGGGYSFVSGWMGYL